MEEEVEIAKQMIRGLLDRMKVEAEVEGSIKEGNISIEITGDKEGILIGKHGRTLEALQILINRMVNKQAKEHARVVLDVDHYLVRRADSLARMAWRTGERVKREGKAITIGSFNARDRRIIHIALQEEPLLRTESSGEGEMKIITVTPKKKEGERIEPLE